MDFDEYEYLEKTVQNPESPRVKEPPASGVRSGDRERRKSSKARLENGDRVAERGSRRARSEDAGEPRDEERQRERSSPRHRFSSERRPREGEREEKDRHRREHREERDMEKERDKERGRDRDRERIRERDRELEKERDKERERSRRSRSRSVRYNEEERPRPYRERSRDRELRDRDRESRERERDSRHHEEKKEEYVEPEADPERDQRTVFAYQINLKADERDVYDFFSKAGKVRDVRLIMDRSSRRSRGVGYIEFYDVMSVPMAIALSGQHLLGQPVMVKPSEAEKNLVQSTSTTAGAAVMGPGVIRRLYVGNLHLNITEDQLRQVFEPFGPVELVQLPVDPETRQCKGYGFVQFARLEDARASQSINGQLEIAGRTIKVSAVSEHVGMQDVGTNAGDFDDDEGGGLALNARSRALLMQKLDRTGIATSVACSLVSPVVSNPALPTASVHAPMLQTTAPALVGLPGTGLPVGIAAVPEADTFGVPSECLLLMNMFDPSVETEPDFDLDIKEDVRDECSKFGAVKHIFVDKNASGCVYLRFDNVTSAINAQRALHGRWFAGKMITATFMLPQNYDAKFAGSG